MRVCGHFIVPGMAKAVRLADFRSVISRVSLTHSLNQYPSVSTYTVSGTGQKPGRPPRSVKGQCGIIMLKNFCLFPFKII